MKPRVAALAALAAVTMGACCGTADDEVPKGMICMKAHEEVDFSGDIPEKVVVCDEYGY